MSISPVRAYNAYPSYQPRPAVTAQAASQPTGGGYYGAQATSSGPNLLQLGSWAAGAFGLFKLARNFNFNPQGFALAGVLAGGAWLGNKAYHMLTGR